MSYSRHRSRRGDPGAAGGSGRLPRAALLPPAARGLLGSHQGKPHWTHALLRPSLCAPARGLALPRLLPPSFPLANISSPFAQQCSQPLPTDELGAAMRTIMRPSAAASTSPALPSRCGSLRGWLSLITSRAQHRAWQPVGVRGLLAEGARSRPFPGGPAALKPQPRFVTFWHGLPLSPPPMNQATDPGVHFTAGEQGGHSLLPQPSDHTDDARGVANMAVTGQQQQGAGGGCPQLTPPVAGPVPCCPMLCE